MKAFAYALAAAALLPWSVSAIAADGQEELTTTLETVETPEEFKMQVQNIIDEVPGTGPLDEANVILDQILNMGKKIWAVIEANKPVANVRYDYATALPKGIDSAADLEGFSPLQYRSYRLSAKNLYGMTVYDIVYTVVHRYGGNVNGKGNYLDAVTILPQRVDVLWGYNVDFAVKRVSVANVGSRVNPVGSLGMELSIVIKTTLQHHEQHLLYEVRGDSAKVAQVYR